MIILTKQQIIFLHAELINQTGGSDGIRDNALLESAIAAPFQEFCGHELFPTIHSKAARLGYGLIKNHAVIDNILFLQFSWYTRHARKIIIIQ